MLYELIFYQLLGVALNMIIYLIENNIVELLDITENQNWSLFSRFKELVLKNNNVNYK